MALIIWNADFDGDHKQLARVSEIMEETPKSVGTELDGPYDPQGASLIYLM